MMFAEMQSHIISTVANDRLTSVKIRTILRIFRPSAQHEFLSEIVSIVNSIITIKYARRYYIGYGAVSGGFNRSPLIK